MSNINRRSIYQLIAEISKKDIHQISDASRFRADLAMDSLGVLDLIVSIEEQYGCKVKPEMMKDVSTVGDFFKVLGI